MPPHDLIDIAINRRPTLMIKSMCRSIQRLKDAIAGTHKKFHCEVVGDKKLRLEGCGQDCIAALFTIAELIDCSDCWIDTVRFVLLDENESHFRVFADLGAKTHEDCERLANEINVKGIRFPETRQFQMSPNARSSFVEIETENVPGMVRGISNLVQLTDSTIIDFDASVQDARVGGHVFRIRARILAADILSQYRLRCAIDRWERRCDEVIQVNFVLLDKDSNDDSGTIAIAA